MRDKQPSLGCAPRGDKELKYYALFFGLESHLKSKEKLLQWNEPSLYLWQYYTAQTSSSGVLFSAHFTPTTMPWFAQI